MVLQDKSIKIKDLEDKDAELVPFISVLCVTMGRPHLIPNLIACFNSQLYPKSRRELIILDDSGQLPNMVDFDGVNIVSFPYRFRTLSQKRNALAGMVSHKCEYVAFWDDDDTFLPWCLWSHACAVADRYAMALHAVSRPGIIMEEEKRGSDHELCLIPKRVLGGMFQATQCIEYNLFNLVGGYPHGNSGVDQQLTSILLDKGGEFLDCCNYMPPWFVYGWSGLNPEIATGNIGHEPLEQVVHLSTYGTGNEYSNPDAMARYQHALDTPLDMNANTMDGKFRRDWQGIFKRSMLPDGLTSTEGNTGWNRMIDGETVATINELNQFWTVGGYGTAMNKQLLQRETA
jgi:hypothetical protein